MDLRSLARALGGEITGASVLAPGPGHSRRDRSLSVTPSALAPDGFLVHSHAGDDWRACRDHVKGLLGIDRDEWKGREPASPRRSASTSTKPDDDLARALASAAGYVKEMRPVRGSAGDGLSPRRPANRRRGDRRRARAGRRDRLAPECVFQPTGPRSARATARLASSGS